MKKVFISSFILLILLGMYVSACDKNDNERIIPIEKLSDKIKNYVSIHFPKNKILKAVEERDNNTIKYELDLEGYISLEFDVNSKVIEIKSYQKLPESVLPAKIIEYVKKNYPDNFIISWELDKGIQQIELNNNLELEFDINGNFLRIDY